MCEEDRGEVFEMMKIFYNSPAVYVKSPEEILMKDIDDCIGDMPLLEGFVFEDESGNIAGYAMTALCYTTEYARVAVWLEDLYVKPEFRGSGIGTQFFSYLDTRYEGKPVRFKLEVERENDSAYETYRYCGYEELPYIVMSKVN